MRFLQWNTTTDERPISVHTGSVERCFNDGRVQETEFETDVCQDAVAFGCT